MQETTTQTAPETTVQALDQLQTQPVQALVDATRVETSEPMNPTPVAEPVTTQPTVLTPTPTTPALQSSDVPNMVIGQIIDPRGLPLANILVEIVDTQKNPVRAFKSAQNGQFATATPLTAGSYLLMCEDPEGKQKFQPMPLLVNDTILSPLTIQSTDEREELRKALFTPSV